MAKQRKHQYKILSQRIDREKKLFVISQKIQARKDLQVRRRRRRSSWFFIRVWFTDVFMVFSSCVHQDKSKKVVKVKKETPNAAPIYKFELKRKR